MCVFCAPCADGPVMFDICQTADVIWRLWQSRSWRSPPPSVETAWGNRILSPPHLHTSVKRGTPCCSPLPWGKMVISWFKYMMTALFSRLADVYQIMPSVVIFADGIEFSRLNSNFSLWRSAYYKSHCNGYTALFQIAPLDGKVFHQITSQYKTSCQYAFSDCISLEAISS